MKSGIIIRHHPRIIDYFFVVILITLIYKSIVGYAQIVISLLLIIGLIGYLKQIWDEIDEILIDEEDVIFLQSFFIKRRQVIIKSTIEKIIICKSSIPGPNELNVEFEGGKTTFTFYGNDEFNTKIINIFSNAGINVEKSSKLRFPRGI